MIKIIQQETSKTTAVTSNNYDSIIKTVDLSDAAGGSFIFRVNNSLIQALTRVLVAAEYSALTGDTTQTVTLTGTSGTANVIVDGVNYLATFTTNLTTSAANFVTSHSATLLALGITVTSNAAVLTFVADTDTFPTIAITNVSGNLAGTVGTATAVASTGNAIASLSAQAKGYFDVRVQNISESALNTFVKIHYNIVTN